MFWLSFFSSCSVPEKIASHTASEKSRYKPGVYTSSITLNENTFDVEVTVNADRIKAIRLVNLNEATKASYPLMEPVLDSLASQIYSSQSLEDIQYAGDRKIIPSPGYSFSAITVQ